MMEHSEPILLDTLVEKKSYVQIYLMGGLRIEGNMIGADEYTVLITTIKHGTQMLYKHCIATVVVG